MIEWFDRYRLVTNRIAVVVLIVLVGFIIGRIVGRLVFRGLKELEISRFFKKQVSFEESIAQVVEYMVYVITVLIALDNLNILVYVLLSVIAVLALAVVLSALLGFRDFIPNFVCGLVIRRRKSIKAGECIVLDKIVGKVTKFGFLTTCLKTKSGDIIRVPNCVVLRKRK